MKFFRYSPNGQRGAFTLSMGRLTICIGYVRSLRGIDIVYRGVMLFSTEKKL